MTIDLRTALKGELENMTPEQKEELAKTLVVALETSKVLLDGILDAQRKASESGLSPFAIIGYTIESAARMMTALAVDDGIKPATVKGVWKAMTEGVGERIDELHTLISSGYEEVTGKKPPVSESAEAVDPATAGYGDF